MKSKVDDVVVLSVSSIVGGMQVHQYCVLECPNPTVEVQYAVVSGSRVKLLSEVKDLKLSLREYHEVI